MQQEKLEKLIQDTLEAINEYGKYVKNHGANGDIKCQVSNNPTKDTAFAQYKGSDGWFKVSVDKKLMKVCVNSKFGADKFEVNCSKNMTYSNGIRPVYHAHWSVFNSIFSAIKD